MARNQQQKKTLFARIWNSAANKSPRQLARQRLLLCEPLEDRRLLSGITSLSGHIFQDSAKTGSYTSQAGVAGAAIQLYDTTANTFQAAVSASNGTFSFSSLTTGDNYYAIVRSPFGYTSFTTANVSSAGQTGTLTSTTLNVGLYGTPVPYGFADGFGGSSSVATGTQGNKVTTDSSGNVYVTGWFQNTVNFDPGLGLANLTAATSVSTDYSVFVAKYTPQGALLWADEMGGAGNAKSFGIAVDSSGNVYTTGFFTGSAQFDPQGSSGTLTSAGGENAFVCMLSTNGIFGWAESASQSGAGSSTDDEGRSIVIVGSSAVVTGCFTNTITGVTGTKTATFSSSLVNSASGTGGTGIFVVELAAASGSLSAGLGWSGGTTAAPRGMAATSTDIYTSGIYESSAAINLNSGITDAPSVTLPVTTSDQDIFVTDFNIADGYVDWAEDLTEKMGGASATDYNEPHGITADSSGNVYVTGYMNDPTNPTNVTSPAGTIFVAKTVQSGTSGAIDWSQALSNVSTASGCGRGVVLVPSGNVDIGGYFSGTVTFDPSFGSATLTSVGTTDGFVAQFNATNGNCQWVVSAGGTDDDDEVRSIAVDSSGDVYATGFFQGTADILGSSFSSQSNPSGDPNALLVKLGSPGTAPAASIDATGANGVPLTTSTSPIDFTVIFNEPVVDFTSSDVTLSGTAGATTKIVTSTGPTSYNVAVSGMTGYGTVIATIPSTSVSHDPYGDASVAAATSSNGDNTVTYSAPLPTFTLSGPTAGTFTAGVSVTIGWTAANVDVAGPSKITLGYDPDSTPFDSNVHWFEVNGVTAANGAGSYAWNTTGVASGTYYLNGYMYDFTTNQQYLSHIGTSIVITGGAPPAFGLTGPSAGTFTAGVSVTIAWSAANVDTAGPTKISLAYDPDATPFDANEHWLEVDGVTAANGTGSYAWNTTGIASGTYYLAGYMYDFSTSTAVYSHLATSFVITGGAPPTFALSGPSAGTFTGGHIVTIQWSATNVDTSGPTKVSLAYDVDSTAFDSNEHWLEVDQVTAANGAGSYAWNTTGVASGTYYLAGYMYDFSTSTAVYSHLATPFVITGGAPPTFALSGPTAGTFSAGVSVTIGWSATNVDTAGPTKISLAYDPDATPFDANAHWLEVDQVTAGNGAGSYAWNTTGVASGTYYLSGYMYDFSTSTAVYSHLGTSIVITGGAPPTFTLSGPTAGTFSAGVSVTIGWSATNVDTAGPSKISLAYDPDATPFDSNAHWFEIDQVTAANGAGSYAWNTSSVAAGTYYLSGYMYDFSVSKAEYSSIATSIVITAAV